MTRLNVFVLAGCVAAVSAPAVPLLPTIPNGTNNVTSFGAVGNGIATNTTAIQAAIDNIAAGAAKGGTVEIPVGVFLCGPLHLSNSVNLQVDAGATLRMLPYGSYPGGTSPPDFISTASKLHDIKISGTGTIDGQAQNSGWWTNGLATSARPYMIMLNAASKALIQDVTLINPPKMHIALKNGGANLTVQHITINTPLPSPNTDGIDLSGTNCLIANCSISDGDDNVALGSTTATTSDVVITNCNFGVGHGVSIGSNTEIGVSNLTVIHCTFSGTQYGIRMKSDNNPAGGSSGVGGVTQNLAYYDIGMTNIVFFPILVYSYYSEYGTPTAITPFMASTQAVETVTTTTPVWRDITISNLTATVGPSGLAGMLWGRIEMPATNILLSKINITAPQTFKLYNVRAVTLSDVQVNVTNGTRQTFTVFSAQATITNSAPPGPITVDGMTANNAFAFYRAPASMVASDALGANPITVDFCTLTFSNSLAWTASTVLNLGVGTNSAKVAVLGDLNAGGTLNVTDSGGLSVGAYPVFTYSGNLLGIPSLGTTPAGFNYSLSTSTPGVVNLVVSSTAPPSPPSFDSVRFTGNQIIMAGTGGSPNGTYYVLASTNLGLPVVSWPPLATNSFSGLGAFSFTNTIDPSKPQEFYILEAH